MPSESISWNLTADDHASSKFRDVGRAALDSSAKMDVAAASLKLWNDTAQKQGKAAATSEAAMKTHAKASALLADAENVLAGKMTTTTKLMADQSKAGKDASAFLKSIAPNAKDAGNALSGVASSAGQVGIGWGALIAGGVALSPIIATLGVGLGGLALAALAAGKHSKEFAAELAPLKADLATFDKQLQPILLEDFAKAAGLARNVLHDVEPVAAATGKALGGMLASINAEFQSGAWQQFFGFMARTAGPDIKLLTDNFVSLLNVLPPLLESLQPVATTLLKDTTGVLNLANGLEKLVKMQSDFTRAANNSTGWLGKLAHAAGQAFDQLVPGGVGIKHVADQLGRLGTNATASGKGLETTALGAIHAHAPVFDLNTAVAALNKSMTTLVGNLLTLQGENVTWRQSMQAAKKQLDSNTAGLAGNSKNALANRQAIIASSNAAITFASDQLKLGRNIGQASSTVRAQINFLQGLHDKSAFVRREIEALREEEARLNRQRINQTVNVRGLGQWSVSQSLAPGAGHRRAAGGMIPGTGNSDSYPALLTPGEVVVPKGMVRAGAVDHLRGRLPGFADGGIVPSYAGSPGGLGPWIQHNDTATIRLMDQAIVAATVAAIRAARTAALASAPGALGGPTSAGAAAAQAYARSRLGAYGWGGGEMIPLIALWNQESGWNRFARNPSSGAYGIPQALPPGKMGAAANPPTSSAAAQINWGLGYIKGRYGSPSGAELHEREFHWYDRGGFLPPGLSLAYNGTGRPEQVIPHGRGGGGNHYHITVNVPPNANLRDIGRVTVQAIKVYEQGSGSGWRR